MRISILIVIAIFYSQEIFLQAGVLDPDFGQGGWIQTDLGGKDLANAVAVQADGKILVGGQTDRMTGDFDFALLRYLPNGDLDPDFGTLGKMFWDFGSMQEDIEFVNVLSDQKIFLGGWSNKSPNSLGILIRLNPDGSPDTSFGEQGIVKYKFGRSTGPIAMAVQDDGKYLVSGITVVDSFDIDWQVARFYPDGKIDSSFNNVGWYYHKFLTRENIPFSILIQKDHKIFMTGCAGVTSKTNFAFLRLNEDGSLDQSFGNGGDLQTDFKNNQDVAYTSIILDDGKIMVSGTAKDSLTNYDFALARYMPDGKLDPSFGIDGKMTYDLKGPSDAGYYMIQQSDGKFLMCGTNNIIGHNSYVIVRFNSDGTIDPSFGKDGIASLDVGNIFPDNTPFFTMQSDGKLVMVHNYKNGTNFNFLVMRFLDNVIIKNNDPIDQTNLVSIIPNPVTDNINITVNSKLSDSDFKIEIVNLKSQLIEQKLFHAMELKNKTLSYPVKKLIPGMYFINWTSDKITGSIHIIKE